MKHTMLIVQITATLLLLTGNLVAAQESSVEAPEASGAAEPSEADKLAKQLSNPVAALISVPFQYNYDQTYGDDGYKNQVNIQPVIPISISEHWNLISRTIVPIIQQGDVIPGTSQFGLGDTTQSVFFSPKAPTKSGLIWGIGPAALIPTGTDDLSADTWAFGPTFVVLKQSKSWTVGALAINYGPPVARPTLTRCFCNLSFQKHWEKVERSVSTLKPATIGLMSNGLFHSI